MLFGSLSRDLSGEFLLFCFMLEMRQLRIQILTNCIASRIGLQGIGPVLAQIQVLGRLLLGMSLITSFTNIATGMTMVFPMAISSTQIPLCGRRGGAVTAETDKLER